ncbi:peptide deformylase [Methylosinus sp. Sm6]|uniref:peptide deformylase n=1 Tax=Methylosinus sp. Sm6 TaxID=2866948 RepID=UPI001C997461|nr:peptide deformylase [Methylosinus sp. Sm6]MBY6243245.1 peptide deformylase [Methylosinus sp. Sm6]
MPDDPILAIDDPRLKQTSERVERIDDGLRALGGEMFSVMDMANGAGLSAIQIGAPLRVVVTDTPDRNGARRRMALLNPEIVEVSAQTRIEEEGCLSMPGYGLPVERAARVRVRFMDMDGDRREIEADGVFSVCLQHEIDHLNGRLFTDRVSKLRRDRAAAYFAKVRRRHALAS